MPPLRGQAGLHGEAPVRWLCPYLLQELYQQEGGAAQAGARDVARVRRLPQQVRMNTGAQGERAFIEAVAQAGS